MTATTPTILANRFLGNIASPRARDRMRFVSRTWERSLHAVREAPSIARPSVTRVKCLIHLHFMMIGDEVTSTSDDHKCVPLKGAAADGFVVKLVPGNSATEFLDC